MTDTPFTPSSKNSRSIGCLTIIVIIILLAAIGGVMKHCEEQEQTKNNEAITDNKSKAIPSRIFLKPLVLKEIGKLKPEWEDIQMDQRTGDNIRLTLMYKHESYPSYWDAELDTKLIARAVLKTLIKRGNNPYEEHIGILVFAYKKVKGETGADLFQDLGYTTYNWNHDQLNYKESNTPSFLK